MNGTVLMAFHFSRNAESVHKGKHTEKLLTKNKMIV